VDGRSLPKEGGGMKRYRGIKYSFRPKSYWGEDNILQALLRDVKGAERRKMIKTYYEQGNFQELEESFSKASLSDEERFRLASIHPMFMGGEYLPDCQAGETEIARITLRSTTQDVISIRAKKEDGLLWYSVADEYDQNEYSLLPICSKKPFSLKELIELLDSSSQVGGYSGGLSLSYINSNAEAGMDRESLEDFTTISSEIYPQLEKHYNRVFADWVAEEQEEEVSL
tara:strand:- start:362 stop:1045 length:684 start_codon:yes stop_codon:yes gene_type:complete